MPLIRIVPMLHMRLTKTFSAEQVETLDQTSIVNIHKIALKNEKKYQPTKQRIGRLTVNTKVSKQF